MSKEACTFCGTVVSTTSDPNKYEGFFVSLEDIETVEQWYDRKPWHGGQAPYFNVRDGLRFHCRSLVVCDDCQETKLGPTHHELGMREKP